MIYLELIRKKYFPYWKRNRKIISMNFSLSIHNFIFFFSRNLKNFQWILKYLWEFIKKMVKNTKKYPKMKTTVSLGLWYKISVFTRYLDLLLLMPSLARNLPLRGKLTGKPVLSFKASIKKKKCLLPPQIWAPILPFTHEIKCLKPQERSIDTQCTTTLPTTKLRRLPIQ